MSALAWSPDGRLLATGSVYDSRVLVWDVATGVPAALQRFGGTTLLRWSPDGAYLFAGGVNGVFRLWETNTWTCDRWVRVDFTHMYIHIPNTATALTLIFAGA